MNEIHNSKENVESRYTIEGMVLDKLVSRFRIGSPNTTYSELRNEMGSSASNKLEEALKSLKDHNIIYSSDGINYSVTESGISEFERRKNAGLLF
ncbi:MAG: hypothetical protein AB7U98_00185 [Candidatus Nitrosocosmicus sp.]